MKSKLLYALIVITVLSCLALSSCTSVRSVAPAGSRGAEPPIRVLLDTGVTKIKLSATAPLEVKSGGGRTLLSSDGPASLLISSQASGIFLRLDPGGKTASAGDNVRIVPKRAGTVIYNGIAYAGWFRVARESGKKMALVNILPLETYLEGVLPHELGPRGPDEFAAMEAQAVAARTYALSKIGSRSGERFDVHASVMDQVYRGRKGVNKLANSAIRKTRGLVLGYDGKLAFTYYCSTCGGHTSDIALMWPERRNAPYLKGVRDARGGTSFCASSRLFRWRYSYSGSELGVLLRRTLPEVLRADPGDVGYLEDLRVAGRSRSGRVTAIDIKTSRKDFTVTGDRIRWVLLADPKKNRILPSTMFELHPVKDGDKLAFVSIVGGGNGHGVGLCQYGALEMARQGYTFEMILTHYYAGCSIAAKY